MRAEAMHELSITQNIVDIACELAGSRRLRAVRVRIGRLTGIDVRAVRFCYDLCAQGTVAEGSRLEIDEVPGSGRCSQCQREIALDLPLAVCPCERAAGIERVAGDELLVTELEVDDP